jgi:tryptophanyl-tRNA synthetase
MSITTDSKELEDIKDPATCNIFSLYKLLASSEEQQEMVSKYRAGGFGYGHAKQALFELIILRFAMPREKYAHFMEHPEEIFSALELGEKKAQLTANLVISRVRKRLNY